MATLLEVQAAGDSVWRGVEPHLEPKDMPSCPTMSPEDHSVNAAQPPFTSAARETCLFSH
ncbi:hypothetical protein FH972_002405 [Carpinus fangiana]|uniref:Uncharacterized protein n=1 Tax=Carpinus fangiana TaxID=176857 RepID=A0A5N6QER7_9ROSI|nr:hypothetical protein FH972_002405 [Carpinus fangiana]